MIYSLVYILYIHELATWVFLSTTKFDINTELPTVQIVINALAASAVILIKWPFFSTQNSWINCKIRVSPIVRLNWVYWRYPCLYPAPPVDENTFVDRKGYHSIMCKGFVIIKVWSLFTIFFNLLLKFFNDSIKKLFSPCGKRGLDDYYITTRIDITIFSYSFKNASLIC